MKFLILASAVTLVTPQEYRFPPKGSAQQRADYERGQKNQAIFEQKLFADAGFEPIDRVVAGNRVVKRALFSDPYMMLPVPGIEIERTSDGSVTLKVVARTEESDPVALPKSAWSRLTDLQGTMLAPQPYVPWDPPAADEPPPPPPPICHGWIVRFGSADETGAGSGSWAQCGGEKQPGLALAIEMARLAVSTRAECTFDQDNPFWSFNSCFGSSHPADAP